MRISVVVPVLNEAALLAEFLAHVRRTAPKAEIIVVDGGSRDGSTEIAFSLADHALVTAPGRGQQMNAGAAVAQGDVLWFVHADSRLPSHGDAAIADALRNPEMVGGCFSLRIIPTRWVYRVRDWIGNICVDAFGIALGDRAIFCRRREFLAIGGYPEQRLFEDADLYRKLRRSGKTSRLLPIIRTSARRYEAQGPIRTCLFYGLVMLLYSIGLARNGLEELVFKFSALHARAAKIDASIYPAGANDTERVEAHPVTLQLNPNP